MLFRSDWLGAAEGVTGDVLLSLASAGSGGNQDDMWRTLDNSSPSRPGAHSDFDEIGRASCRERV